MNFSGFLTRAIEFSFYALFLLVPLVFTDKTSELFEFNKMWVTFTISVLIGFFWFSKMILQGRIIFKRTILDIPILLFLASHVISTVVSMDPYVSFWGYYSRWNGGLLSIIAYIFLYYAFVSNFWNNAEGDSKLKGFFNQIPAGKTIVLRSLLVSLISGFLVILWSIPSHFGYDPTCFMFRGTLDVSCWTNDFQPRIRIFGPLGQPDWLAGYLGILIPIAGAFSISELRKKKEILNPSLIFYSSCFVLFYVALLYTGSRSGIISGIFSILVLFLGYALFNRKNLGFIKNRFTAIFVALMILATFFAGIRLPVIEKFSLTEVQKIISKNEPAPLSQTPSKSEEPVATTEGGSNSLHIRFVVWEGAIAAWKANPIIGTGVETFAFAYYQYRPIEHNKLSEWNFLYNKAHNEYLNYLTTTGLFGLLSYLSFLGLFLAIALTNLANLKIKLLKHFHSQDYDQKDPLLLALTSSFLSIIIINFFGFSVVILNIYLLLIPAFVLIYFGFIKTKTASLEVKNDNVSYGQWAGISLLGIAGLFMIWVLLSYWRADTKYALGYNYNRVQEYQTAYPLLHDAIKIRPDPVYLDEMAVNDAFIAAGIAAQNATESAQIAQTLVTEALSTSDKLVAEHPHNIVFWKSRVRILYTLANVNSTYLPQALEAIKKTAEIAPTDASVLYNLGVIYGQGGDTLKAVEILEKTLSYKPDYREAHFALALFYHDLGVNEKSQITDSAYHDKAVSELKFILEKLDPTDKQARDSLTLWEKER